jgi:hypothetical protein
MQSTLPLWTAVAGMRDTCVLDSAIVIRFVYTLHATSTSRARARRSARDELTTICATILRSYVNFPIDTGFRSLRQERAASSAHEPFTREESVAAGYSTSHESISAHNQSTQGQLHRDALTEAWPRLTRGGIAANISVEAAVRYKKHC